MKTFVEFLKLRENQPAPPNNMQQNAQVNKQPTPQELQSQQRVKQALKTTVAATKQAPGKMDPTKVINKADSKLSPEELAKLTRIASTGE